MRGSGLRLKWILAPALLLATAAQGAQGGMDDRYWQCAAFARQFSGIEIRGDAWTWWDKADGIYAKGYRPRVGAVMAFAPTGRTPLGHVATVTGVRDARTVTVTHANWSPIDGQRGQIERDVEVRDVSDAGDWSRVRVWFAPLGDLGTTAWPVRGFIYPGGAARRPLQVASFNPSRSVPKLSYAGLGQMIGEGAERPSLIGTDVIRLAMLEQRRSPPR